MEIMMNKKTRSTVDEFKTSMNQKEKETFDKEYKELLLSEMILAAVENDRISVSRLAKLAGVLPLS
jgi:hypothetical protein